MGCHNLWMWRNKEVHNDSFQSPYFPFAKIIQHIEEYDNVMTNSNIDRCYGRTKVRVSWKPPSQDWEKLNTYGARRNDGATCIWSIIRDMEGKSVGGLAKNVGIYSAFRRGFEEYSKD